MPPGFKEVGTKWVFQQNVNADGTIQRYKVRLVAKKISQRSGIDYGEVHEPVSRYYAMRTLLATAVQNWWDLLQLDVQAAFFNGLL